MNKKIGVTIVSFLFLLSGCASNQLSSKDNGSPQKQVATGSSTQPAATTKSDNGSSTKSGTTANQKIPIKNIEKPLAPEKNPVGDIPDTQAFVNYSSSQGGYSVQVPEGWARTENGAEVSFIDKFDGVKSTYGTNTKPFSLDNINNNQVKDLITNGRAIKIVEIREVSLPGGKAVVVHFLSNSEPNSVTNKQIRLENQTFYFDKNGKIGSLTVWAPLGSDNVDQWKKISESWRWK